MPFIQGGQTRADSPGKTIMTQNKAQKTEIRQRMAETGEPYNVARHAVERDRDEDSAVGDGTLGHGAVGDSAVGDSAVGDSAVGDSAVGDSAVGDSPRTARGSASRRSGCGPRRRACGSRGHGSA
jgi:hypothetical protein